MRRKVRRPLHGMGRSLLAVAVWGGLLAGAGSVTAVQPIRTPSYVGHTTVLRPATPRQAASSSPIDPTGYKFCSNPQNLPPSQAGPPAQGSAYAAGYADASKLGGAAVLGLPDGAFISTTSRGDEVLGPAQNVPGPPGPSGDFYYCILGTFQLDYQGQPEFPPSTATFMANGFIPVTGTIHVTQVPGGAPVTVVEYRNHSDTNDQNVLDAQTQPATVVATAEVFLRLSDVKVDGVPLDVGPDCHTVRPLSSPDPVADPENNLVVLTGGGAPGEPTPLLFDAFTSGGATAGTVAIPPFTGCGIGDNLDPLFDASVSGPGNYMKLMQAPACAFTVQPANHIGVCAPGSTKPPTAPLWTIGHSGSFTSSAPLTLRPTQTQPGTYLINCDSEIAGTIGPDPGGLPPRDVLGTFAWTKISNCTGPLPGWTWTVTPTGTVTFAPQFAGGGDVSGNLYGISFSMQGTGPPENDNGVTVTPTCSFSFTEQTEQNFPARDLTQPQFVFANPSTFEMGLINDPVGNIDSVTLLGQPSPPGTAGGNDCFKLTRTLPERGTWGIFGGPPPNNGKIEIFATYHLPGNITITSP
jgi:hypothetical protein